MNVTERITSVASSNYRSDNPPPMLMKIGANVDASYDVQIKNFIHDGIEYIGILMLCPNPALTSPAKVEQREKALV